MSVLKYPAPRDRTEVSFSQNLLDNFGFPHDFIFTTDEILDRPSVKNSDAFREHKDKIEMAKGT